MMGDHAMQIPCEDATALVPSYLDGELTEAQAAPLRAHLLGCVDCREVAKDGKALQRWFVAGAVPVVPVGFAARVARRAFAGDPGEIGETSEIWAPSGGEREPALLPFVLRLTATAAAVLLFLAAAMQLQSRPTASDELRADDLDRVWEEIYGMDVQRPVEALPVPLAPEDPRGATGARPARR